MNDENNNSTIPEEYKPLAPSDYVWYNLLFLIPIVGIIFLIIFSFDKKNINRKNYARSFIGSVITFVALFVLIICLEIHIFTYKKVMPAKPGHSEFIQVFGEYSDQVLMDGANVEFQLNKEGIEINDAQKFYIVANGISKIYQNSGDAFNMQIPAGYEIPDVIKNALNLEEKKDIVAYLITDNQLSGFKYNEDVNFYSKEEEYHFVTSEGTVFTLPGFEVEQEDGSSRYYISFQNHYYTVIGTSNLEEAVENCIVNEPIVAEDFINIYGIDNNYNTVNESAIYKEKLNKN